MIDKSLIMCDLPSGHFEVILHFLRSFLGHFEAIFHTINLPNSRIFQIILIKNLAN